MSFYSTMQLKDTFHCQNEGSGSLERAKLKLAFWMLESAAIAAGLTVVVALCTYVCIRLTVILSTMSRNASSFTWRSLSFHYFVYFGIIVRTGCSIIRFLQISGSKVLPASGKIRDEVRCSFSTKPSEMVIRVFSEEYSRLLSGPRSDCYNNWNFRDPGFAAVLPDGNSDSVWTCMIMRYKGFRNE